MHLPTSGTPPRYNPWRHAEQIDLRIIYRQLPGRMIGYAHRPSRIIVLAPDLRQAERRSTLAHELVHYERGDTGCITGWHNRKQEALVSGIAARRLILVEDLADAVLTTLDAVDRAERLWVDLDTLTVRLMTLTDDERDYLRGQAQERDFVA